MNDSKHYFVYIITNKADSVLYIGVTDNLMRRMFEHKNKIITGFSKKYNLSKLVFYETTNNISSAIMREKQLKNWHRDWKENLINQSNPDWKDLTEEFI